MGMPQGDRTGEFGHRLVRMVWSAVNPVSKEEPPAWAGTIVGNIVRIKIGLPGGAKWRRCAVQNPAGILPQPTIELKSPPLVQRVGFPRIFGVGIQA